MPIKKVTSKTYTRPKPKKKYARPRAVDLNLAPGKPPTQAQELGGKAKPQKTPRRIRAVDLSLAPGQPATQAQEMGTKKANPIHPYT